VGCGLVGEGALRLDLIVSSCVSMSL
jgi:hypothetical protein